ncbi:hypothetical protein BK648_07625 [Pseudomonas poae]|uniref:NADPH-dependent FMN reductase-like domain-containing protein n=1 Tax=Pseudomonas poae TaxID=200451 RepID=A0A423FAQ6_9PSED|nr:NADPH-dependent FMN reductase [Pseudomonas poae]ROM53407.1 hypothetical protein BK648_07625 [Pseudomonas poae]
MTENKVKLLGIAGSLRTASVCKAVLRKIAANATEDFSVEPFDIGSVPLYNEEIDYELPLEPIADLRNAIAGCDAVVIVSSEYNYGMPGVLKNTLDWASRPAKLSRFIDKPVLVITASPAFTGGVRAQGQIAETLRSMGANVLAVPQIVIGSVHQKITDGEFDDPSTEAFIMNTLTKLIDAVRDARK